MQAMHLGARNRTQVNANASFCEKFDQIWGTPDISIKSYVVYDCPESILVQVLCWVSMGIALCFILN